MSKPIPTLKQLYDQTAADLKNKLQLFLSDDQLKMALDAFAATWSGQLKATYLFLADIEKNLFPDTAELAEYGGQLNRIGQIRLNRQPYPPKAGVYTAIVTGVNGTAIRAGMTFKSNDDSNSPGNLYITDTEYILAGSSGTIQIRALDAGPDYLLNVGNKLTATEPVIGLDQQITISSVVSLPAAAETEALYRQRILDNIRLEPQGGAKTDYRKWAADAQGVERVYPYVKNGAAGVVQIYVEATATESTDGHGTPPQALLDAVEQVIEFDPDDTIADVNDRGRRPAQAIIEMLPVNPRPVDVTITGLQTRTTAIETNIATNLADYLFKIRPYIAGADLARDKNDILTGVKLQSVVNDTVGNANSFTDFTMSVDGVEVNTYTFALANIPYLRNVNYS